MLVLSRKADQSIHFPNLGIKIEVLQINGKTVKVGVHAPNDIAILRGEIAEAENAQAINSQAVDARSSSSKRSEERHELRNQLHAARMALHLLQRQLEMGKTDNADRTLTRALKALGNLDEMAAKPVAIRKEISKAISNEIGKHNESAGDKRNSTETRCHALIVEDNANERHLMRGFLEMCGYQVDAVEDGEAALEFLATHSHPDVVLMDVNMPRMDGPTTVTAIRNDPAYDGIKLFMVSGENREDVNVTEGVMGIQQWFSKPIEPSEFASGLAQNISFA